MASVILGTGTNICRMTSGCHKFSFAYKYDRAFAEQAALDIKIRKRISSADLLIFPELKFGYSGSIWMSDFQYFKNYILHRK